MLEQPMSHITTIILVSILVSIINTIDARAFHFMYINLCLQLSASCLRLSHRLFFFVYLSTFVFCRVLENHDQRSKIWSQQKSVHLGGVCFAETNLHLGKYFTGENIIIENKLFSDVWVF
jgi:hypothetical protein